MPLLNQFKIKQIYTRTRINCPLLLHYCPLLKYHSFIFIDQYAVIKHQPKGPGQDGGLYFFAGIPAESMKWPLGIFCIVFPLWFFRYARALWLGFDVFWDPTSEANAGNRREPASRG